jgi:hypothetical protein
METFNFESNVIQIDSNLFLMPRITCKEATNFFYSELLTQKNEKNDESHDQAQRPALALAWPLATAMANAWPLAPTAMAKAWPLATAMAKAWPLATAMAKAWPLATAMAKAWPAVA